MPGRESVRPKVSPVRTRRDWNSFHRLPKILYAGTPNWVAPLALQSRQTWAPRHPLFDHVEACAWLARRGDRVVGRISAQVDCLNDAHGRADLGMFGQLEAVDDPVVFEALLAAAGDWLRARGKTRIEGPYDLSINQQCGLLVEGFEHRAMMMMGYHQPFYARRLEALGFAAAAELLAYRGSTCYVLPDSVARLIGRVRQRIELHPVARSGLAAKAEDMRALFNASWAGNRGFVPFTRAEFAHMVGEMKPLIRPGYVQLACVDAEPVGFIVALPDLNELIADLDGRLWPGGAIKLLWRLWRKRGSAVRVPLMGVLPRYHRTPMGAGISYAMIEAIREHVLADGVASTEQSWILADNAGMRSIVEAIGMRVAQRYRLYARSLT